MRNLVPDSPVDPQFVDELRIQASMWDLEVDHTPTATEVLTRRYLAAVDAQRPLPHARVAELFARCRPQWERRDDVALLVVAVVTGIGMYAAVLTVTADLAGSAAAIVAAAAAVIATALSPLWMRRILLSLMQSRSDVAVHELDSILPARNS